MKTNKLIIIGLIIFACNSSCNQDKFEELLTFEDSFLEITALLDENSEGDNFDYEIIYLETDGLNNLVETKRNRYYSTIRKQPLSFADKIVNGYDPYFSSTSVELIKNYKNVGVIIKPQKKIISFNILISDVHLPDKPHILDLDIELNQKMLIKIIYDFDSDTHTIEYIDE